MEELVIVGESGVGVEGVVVVVVEVNVARGGCRGSDAGSYGGDVGDGIDTVLRSHSAPARQ